jgi:hypothetical protein
MPHTVILDLADLTLLRSWVENSIQAWQNTVDDFDGALVATEESTVYQCATRGKAEAQLNRMKGLLTKLAVN